MLLLTVSSVVHFFFSSKWCVSENAEGKWKHGHDHRGPLTYDLKKINNLAGLEGY